MTAYVCYGIIPARFGSSRFPGKPLADILGKPMIVRVYERARRCGALEDIVVATDSRRIADVATANGIRAIMTRSDHASGSDRVLEAAEILGLPDTAIVVNIQGDEPALQPVMLSEVLSPFADPKTEVATLATVMAREEVGNPDQVKVVVSAGGKAIYFSRSPIPYARDGQHTVYYRHVGLYAFRLPALKRFVAMGPGRLEKTERLEQLRLLEAGIPIDVVTTESGSFGVDRPEDVDTVAKIITSQEME
ncbi:MAG: 3-deoxy-manno-octulosonate cytidylyltransferase [Desulfobacterales bacterium]